VSHGGPRPGSAGPVLAAQTLQEVAADAFGAGFDHHHAALLPWMEDGLLVCPGSVLGTAVSHRCRFVALDGRWCWEHPMAIYDEIRRTETLRPRFASVTLVGIEPGSEIVVVDSTVRRAVHRMTRTVVMVLENGALTVVHVGTRAMSKRRPELPEHR
jgi:hypothetical protein